MKTLKKVANIIVNVILWVLVIVIAFFAIITLSSKSSSGVANIFGYSPMTVQSDSMIPTFKTDDLIMVKKGDPTSYKEGDIITYWGAVNGQRSKITHRIVEVINTDGLVQYKTRGDNNPADDTNIVSVGDVIGKYIVKIAFLGKVLSLLSSSTGFLIIIVLPLLAFFIYQLYKFIMLLVELKKQTVIKATQEATGDLEAQKQKAIDEAVAAAKAEFEKQLVEKKDEQTPVE